MKQFNKIIFGFLLIVGMLSASSLLAYCKHNSDQHQKKNSDGSYSYNCQWTQGNISFSYQNLDDPVTATGNSACFNCGCKLSDHTQNN